MSNIECPNCSHGFDVCVSAQSFDEQTLIYEINYEGDMLAAGTVHGTLKSLEELLKVAGEEAGAPVNVYINRIEQGPGKLRVSLLVVSASKADDGK